MRKLARFQTPERFGGIVSYLSRQPPVKYRYFRVNFALFYAGFIYLNICRRLNDYTRLTVG